LLQAAWDGASWVLAVPLTLSFRYDFAPPPGTVTWALIAGVGAAVLQWILGYTFQLYRGRYVVASFDEVFGVAITVTCVGIVGTAAVWISPYAQFPRSTFALASIVAAVSMLGARFLYRGVRHRTALRRSGTRTIIYGAGDAGSQIASLMLTDARGDFQPIGFLDDDPSKARLRRHGLRVLGTRADLEDVIDQYAVDTVLVAIAGVSAPDLLEIDQRCAALGARVQVIPTATEIVGGAVKLGDISDVTEEDLMGRRPIKTDEGQITELIRGKRILVTGAGGSIGSELVRQLNRYAPARLALLDRDESALHAVQLTLDGTGTLTSDALILADIRDAEKVREIFQRERPHIIFHAAALKHLPLLEAFPDEAFKTNVVGTANVLKAARDASVDVFVNISTDKAADPTSILGLSKLVTERLTAGVNAPSQSRFVSVRFGNVLGSRGSVIDTFRYQIKKGGPVTVTDENVTRYFMTLSEAVHLVLQATVIGSDGETLVLDMGSPVKILDVAQHMIRRSGRDVEITFTGLRPGEKIHEILVATHESQDAPIHPLIWHTRATPLSLSEVDVAGQDPTRADLERLGRTSAHQAETSS
jgi:dTDP-glucose 4,6-dehydratase